MEITDLTINMVPYFVVGGSCMLVMGIVFIIVRAIRLGK